MGFPDGNAAVNPIPIPSAKSASHLRDPRLVWSKSRLSSPVPVPFGIGRREGTESVNSLNEGIGIHQLSSQPPRDLSIKAEMKLHLRVVQRSPSAFVNPEFNQAASQTVVIESDIAKEKPKFLMIVHVGGCCWARNHQQKMRISGKTLSLRWEAQVCSPARCAEAPVVGDVRAALRAVRREMSPAHGAG